jgi:hypothetical protein
LGGNTLGGTFPSIASQLLALTFNAPRRWQDWPRSGYHPDFVVLRYVAIKLGAGWKSIAMMWIAIQRWWLALALAGWCFLNSSIHDIYDIYGQTEKCPNITAAAVYLITLPQST